MHTQNLSRLSGDVFKAALVAYEDFSKHIQNENDGTAFVRYTSKIENYNIEFASSAAQWVISFHPKSTEDMVIKGGGAEYKITKDSYRIASKYFSK